ncbi:hypothetical protein NM688_g5842 [Phlebia brevispora]|uniref:Uncharacterized protein n=1 Tax=Phlebia brevispora TaxID=194682 RepID=A0ACC1SNS3_9APHY|nr:hypothetical protein NM688_g5842 [Phlebia brevispora]
MTIKLSSEAYLRFPVKITHPKQDTSPCPNMNTLEKGCIDEKFEFEDFISGRTYTRALRTVRYNTLDVDSDVEHTAHSDNVFDKYCTPVVEVANMTILKSNVPKLSVLLRKDCSYTTGQFVIGARTDRVSCETESDRRTWHPPSIGGHYPSRATRYPDWNINRKCFVVVFFMPPGSINPDDLHVDDDHNLAQQNPVVYYAFASMVCQVHETKAAFGILTDETTSFVADFRYRWDLSFCMPTISVISSLELQLRFFLSLCIYMEADAWRLTNLHEERPRVIVRDALNNPQTLDTCTELSHYKDKKWFSDFDLYTMQRVPELWFQFCLWREYVQEEGLKHPIVPGASITFEAGGFVRRQGLLRCPHPRHELPQDTIDSLFGKRSRRPRNAALDVAISSSDSVWLTITQAIVGCDEVVCLKLFDERYFPILEIYDDECIFGRPETRLCSLNFSEDLARREESVYDRLMYLQGILLPHCYEFHLFTLPDGWQCYGIIMERIVGQSLATAKNSPPEPGIQMLLISQIRHGVRAMRAAGISQKDWHPGQILRLDDEHGTYVVFIDFAFCSMYLGETTGFPPTGDLNIVPAMLKHKLGFDKELVSKNWIPALDFEY